MKNIYLTQKSKKDCNGCKVCAMICPVNAIEMIEDDKGFEYPKIDEKKCINCQKCKNICSNFNDSNNISKAYMAINKNKLELEKSSSGGMFIIIARYIIEKNGVVFGVEFDENLIAKHSFAETLEECKKFQGSKYVRSDVNDCYKKVKEFLENDRWVLFSGTPCQCNALKVYLNKDYEKLVTCDIICHANPSPKVFRKYISELEKINNKKIKEFYFRSKENGWHNATPIIKFEDGSAQEDDIYSNAFMYELIGRDSCHSCKFVSSKRVTDFTIGDFWGVSKVFPEVQDNNTGISVFIVNTPKANDIFKFISKYMEYREIDVPKAFVENHCANEKMHKRRNRFFRNLDKISVIENMRNSLKETFLEKCFIKSGLILKGIIRKIIKK